ncbi:hypothetical protein CYMTET_29874, partial [Cymbomonas tetramitiformis]
MDEGDADFLSTFQPLTPSQRSDIPKDVLDVYDKRLRSPRTIRRPPAEQAAQPLLPERGKARPHTARNSARPPGTPQWSTSPRTSPRPDLVLSNSHQRPAQLQLSSRNTDGQVPWSTLSPRKPLFSCDVLPVGPKPEAPRTPLARRHAADAEMKSFARTQRGSEIHVQSTHRRRSVLIQSLGDPEDMSENGSDNGEYVCRLRPPPI